MWYADRKIVVFVAVEVAPAERLAEVLELGGITGDTGRVLRPNLVDRRGEAAGRAVDHLDDPGVLDRAKIFFLYAHGKIGGAIRVEVRAKRWLVKISGKHGRGAGTAG